MRYKKCSLVFSYFRILSSSWWCMPRGVLLDKETRAWTMLPSYPILAIVQRACVQGATCFWLTALLARSPTSEEKSKKHALFAKLLVFPRGSSRFSLNQCGSRVLCSQSPVPCLSFRHLRRFLSFSSFLLPYPCDAHLYLRVWVCWCMSQGVFPKRISLRIKRNEP